MRPRKTAILFHNLVFILGIVAATGCGDDDTNDNNADGGVDSGKKLTTDAEADSSVDSGKKTATDAEADSSVDGGEKLAIARKYADSYGTSYDITDERWTQVMQGDTSAFVIAESSNENHYLIAQNDKNNKYFPGLWSRIDWTEKDGSLYYCQTVYNADSKAVALEATPADPTDPDNAGCSQFSWTKLTPE
jgi:hypothetical protein